MSLGSVDRDEQASRFVDDQRRARRYERGRERLLDDERAVADVARGQGVAREDRRIEEPVSAEADRAGPCRATAVGGAEGAQVRRLAGARRRDLGADDLDVLPRVLVTVGQ